MNNITLNKEETRSYDRTIKLNNGTLLVHYNKLGTPVNVYLVTSFRNNKEKEQWKNTSNYCSCINLDNCQITFEEPCSRNTTELRLLRHLCRCCDNAGMYNYHYNDERIDGSYVIEYKLNDYHIDIKTN